MSRNKEHVFVRYDRSIIQTNNVWYQKQKSKLSTKNTKLEIDGISNIYSSVEHTHLHQTPFLNVINKN